MQCEEKTALTNNTLNIVWSEILMLVNTVTGTLSLSLSLSLSLTHTHTARAHAASFTAMHAMKSPILVLPSGSVKDSSLLGCDVSKEHTDLTCKSDYLALL